MLLTMFSLVKRTKKNNNNNKKKSGLRHAFGGFSQTRDLKGNNDGAVGGGCSQRYYYYSAK